MLKVEMGPDCLPNRELSLLFGRLTLGHFPVGHVVELVQGSRRSACLHSIASVSSLVLFLQTGVLSLTSLFPSGVLSLTSLFPSEVDQFQTQF